MPLEQPLTPVVAHGGDPYQVGGRAGRAGVLVALVQRDETSTLVGFDPDHLTVVGHITRTRTSDERGDQFGDVKDSRVREDVTERGVGFGLCQAAQDFAGIGAWAGAQIPASTEADGWIFPGSPSGGGRAPSPIIDLTVDAVSGTVTDESEMHIVLHRDSRAVAVALAADRLVWIGHLAWTINRPGGRLGGDQAGRIVGEVQRVDTREGFRGQGVAARMYRTARQVAARQGWPAEIDHNPSRTALGDCWAEKVGGWRPPLTYGQPMPDYDDLMRRLQGG
jgi:GNAT superfamily N-acetyltransferase